jgi:hypothetical protein
MSYLKDLISWDLKVCDDILVRTIIVFLDIIYRPVFIYLKYNVSETGFCFRLQVEAIHSDPIDRASLYLRQ